jgi:hypothetical protein
MYKCVTTQVDSSLLGPWHCWGGQKVLRLALKPDPDLWPLASPLPDCFSACKTPQELLVTELAWYVDLFHLVIADIGDQRLSPSPMAWPPPIKPTTHFQPSHCTLNPKEWQSCGLVPINLSFPHMAWSLFGSTLQFLTDLFTGSWSLSHIDLCHLKVSVLVPLQWGHQTLSCFGFPTYPCRSVLTR